MLAKLSVDQALMKAKSYAKKGKVAEAEKLYKLILQTFSKNKRAQQGLDALTKTSTPAITQNPPQLRGGYMYDILDYLSVAWVF